MRKQHWAGLALASMSTLCATHAEAHFRLLQPPSWLQEDELGGPQKGSPCGPGNTMLILGDDVQPVPTSDAVTTFSAGQTVTFELDETVYHPGYFRVSLAHTTAARATTKDFPNPALTDPVDCHYDVGAVPTGAHDKVLADGLFMAEGQDGENRSLRPSIKLPNEPCDECTIQVVQVMEGHPGSSCFYFHCANIKIVAGAQAGRPDAGTGSSSDGGLARDASSAPDASRVPDDSRGGDAATGRTSDQGKKTDAGPSRGQADTGGCSARPAATISSPGLVCLLLTATIVGFARRRPVRMLRRRTL
jgi:hypothetical protein